VPPVVIAGSGRLSRMTPEEFRTAGHRLIDWIADYRLSMEQRPVRPSIDPGQVKAAMASEPGEPSVDVEPLLAFMDSVVVPGSTMVQHPMHYGWFPSNAGLASVLGDIASSGLGSLGISWESGPALTEVEEVVTDWLRKLVGLSDRWSSTIHDTASTSCLVALILARERASGNSYADRGLAGLDEAPVVYCTDHSHSSVRKAALLAGYGSDNVRIVAHDRRDFSMDVADLRAAIEADAADGRRPAAVVATIGTTGTTAVDPLAEIVAVAAEDGLWVHVDAAMAGSVMILPDHRHLWAGVEDADSITWNPHKWLGTILDTSIFHIRNTEFLIQVMSTNPSYLQSGADGTVTQYRDWGIPLGRRFRALKILFHLSIDGVGALQARLRRDLDNARWLAEQIEAAPDWQVVAPVVLQTVCVVHHPRGADSAGADDDLDVLNRHTLAWVEAINRSGEAYLTPTMLDGRWVARVSIGVETTEREHVARLWGLMKNAVSAS